MAAGLGFKTFTTGEVLTAADVNGYLMQGILVFANATARDAAITSPQEGQCCYLKDTDAVLTYSGSAWVGFDDSNAIQNSIVDAKGDLITATASDVPARLAVSATNNMVLVTDSAQSTGLKWSSDYTAYTPSWTASGTAPAIGNGTLSGNYLLVGKLCYVQIFFLAGSTTTFGTGEWRFSLPFAANEQNAGAGGYPCSGYVEDAGIAGYQILAARRSGGNQSFATYYTTSNFLGPTTPFTWGNGDFIRLSLVYGIA